VTTENEEMEARIRANMAAQQVKRSRDVAYVELRVDPDAGRIVIAFGSVDDGSLLQPDDWLPRAEAIWEPLLSILGVVAGEDHLKWIVSRTRCKFTTSQSNDRQPFPGHVELEKTIVGTTMSGRWKSIDSLLVLDEWILADTIDDDIIHFFLTPYDVYSPIYHVPEDHGVEATTSALQVAAPLGQAVGSFLAEYLGDSDLEVEFAKPRWGEENTPVFGASSYEYIGVVSEGASTNPAKHDGDSTITVFMCHGSEDKDRVRELTRRLRATDFIICWFDEDQILPGQDWELEITRGVRASDAFLVCLSNSSSTRAGYLQKEIKKALDVAEERPEGSIFIIPVRLDDCAVPDRLRDVQWVDLFESGGFGRLLRGLAAVRVNRAPKH
jgi:hypothetical protein